ncbi:squalene/phytoene synthase family protein, partial [Bacillus thuringiensis]|nr:squalene/phytoene synthase family protein [Bacillus thuringiensis]
LERDTASALADGFSSNLIVHAFAATARRTGITTELTAPVFASMREDLARRTHDGRSIERYVYGSAESVGLMCLCVFRGLPGTDARRSEELTNGAR